MRYFLILIPQSLKKRCQPHPQIEVEGSTEAPFRSGNQNDFKRFFRSLPHLAGLAGVLGCTNDQELLRAFSHDGSQEAFATLAERYAGLLYHAALRLTASPELAQEAAQNSLAILARKAASLHSVPSLAAWLHRTVEQSRYAERKRCRELGLHRAGGQVG